MKEYRANTKAAQAIIDDLNRGTNKRTIWDAYGRPSATKVAAFKAIARRAAETIGYNFDLHIVGASSCFFSTIYSYTVDGVTTIIKDTPSQIYKVVLEA